MTRILAATLLFVLATAASAQQPAPAPDRIMANELDLAGWCEQEAKHRCIARNLTPYQWTSRYFERSNVLHVEGSLRVHGEDVQVRCRAARGAREQYAVIEIDDPAIR